MTKERKERIGYLLFKHHLREKGIRLSPNLMREIGNEAKAIGIPVFEAKEFVETVVRELVDEVFVKPSADDMI